TVPRVFLRAAPWMRYFMKHDPSFFPAAPKPSGEERIAPAKAGWNVLHENSCRGALAGTGVTGDPVQSIGQQCQRGRTKSIRQLVEAQVLYGFPLRELPRRLQDAVICGAPYVNLVTSGSQRLCEHRRVVADAAWLRREFTGEDDPTDEAHEMRR